MAPRRLLIEHESSDLLLMDPMSKLPLSTMILVINTYSIFFLLSLSHLDVFALLVTGLVIVLSNVKVILLCKSI